MILQKQNEAQIIIEGEVHSTVKSKLDLESTDFIMQMLSKGFYADPIGSLIRELTSNGIDSHRKANITDPVVVSLYSENGQWFFSVEDFGVGLDQNTVETVISMYGKSTKREDEKALGAYGLGWKSPLAYNSSFYFIGRKDGIERKWLQSENEEGSNDIDLLYENETSERNGVKVIVPIQNIYDKREFENKIKEQLCYFKDVYFNIDGFKNDFSIYREVDFQWSELCNDSEMHMCLDDVYYPIDWQKLDIPRINVPVGLRFSLSDGIIPLPNRESIRYNNVSKQIIANKIKKVAEWFVNKYNDTITGKEFDIKSAFEYFRSSYREIPHFKDNSKKIRINDLLAYSSIKIVSPKINGIEKLDLERISRLTDYLLGGYNIIYNYSKYNNRFSSYRNTKLKEYYLDQNSCFIFENELGKKKQNYLRTQLKGNNYFIKKVSNIQLGKLSISGKGYDNWISILELRNYPKSDWRQLISEAKLVQQMLLKNVKDVDKIDIPQDWIEARKAERLAKKVNYGNNYTPRDKKLKGEVTCKKARNLERYSGGRACTFDVINVKLNEIHKQKKPYIFCLQNEQNERIIQKWYNAVEYKVNFVVFSEREYKKVKDITNHNWIKLEDFITCKHKILKRLGTYAILKNFQDDSYLFNQDLRHLSKNIYDKI